MISNCTCQKTKIIKWTFHEDIWIKECGQGCDSNTRKGNHKKKDEGNRGPLGSATDHAASKPLSKNRHGRACSYGSHWHCPVLVIPRSSLGLLSARLQPLSLGGGAAGRREAQTFIKAEGHVCAAAVKNCPDTCPWACEPWAGQRSTLASQGWNLCLIWTI